MGDSNTFIDKVFDDMHSEHMVHCARYGELVDLGNLKLPIVTGRWWIHLIIRYDNINTPNIHIYDNYGQCFNTLIGPNWNVKFELINDKKYVYPLSNTLIDFVKKQTYPIHDLYLLS